MLFDICFNILAVFLTGGKYNLMEYDLSWNGNKLEKMMNETLKHLLGYVANNLLWRQKESKRNQMTTKKKRFIQQ